MKDQAIKVLKKAKFLIQNKENWTTGAFARKADLKPCFPTDPEACMWCAEGALKKVLQDMESEIDRGYVERFLQISPSQESDDWIETNDFISHGAVMVLFDLKIMELEK